ncbi:unnamed protein product [Calypogeia fissa]
MPRYIVKATHSCAIHEKSSHYNAWNCSSTEALHVQTYDRLRDQYRDIFKLPPSVPFELIYFDLDEDRIRITNLEDLRYALLEQFEEGMDEQLGNPLRVRVVAKCSIPILKVIHGDSYYQFPQVGQERLSYEQLHRRVRDHFRVPLSAEVVFIYTNSRFPLEHMTVVNDEELDIAMAQESRETLQLDLRVIKGRNDINVSSWTIAQNLSYIVKAMHNGTLCRLTLARGEMGFSFEDFRTRIRGLFNLPPSAVVSLSYTDEDQDNITMVEDGDLEDALVLQSLHPLKVRVTTVEGDNNMNVNPVIDH